MDSAPESRRQSVKMGSPLSAGDVFPTWLLEHSDLVMRETARRVLNSKGYVGLEMFEDAENELIANHDLCESIGILNALATVYRAAKQWGDLENVTRKLVDLAPEFEDAWIECAQAIEKNRSPAAALAMLLEGEKHHTNSLTYQTAVCEMACRAGNRDQACRSSDIILQLAPWMYSIIRDSEDLRLACRNLP